MISLWRRLRAARAVSRAVAARRDRRWLEAAAGYEAAAALRPEVARFRIQAGHMRKEGGDLEAAERHYQAAEALLPDDAELALQFGHLYSVAGRLVEAHDAYSRALTLRPGFADASRALESIRAMTPGFAAAAGALTDDGKILPPSEILQQSLDQRLLPEYLPTGGHRPLPGAGISIRRLGRFDRSAWGAPRTLQGIEAILAHCISADPVDEVRILLNGRLFRRVTPTRQDLERSEAQPALAKYAFNLWLDVSALMPGRFHLTIAFHAAGDDAERTAARAWSDYVTIVPPAGAPRLPGSESWVPPVDPSDRRSLDDQINARSSIVRTAPTRVIEPPRTILVLRTDQLGDLSISVPALQRLRALAPEARIVGLLTAANADLARTLGLFDEVIVADFPDVPAERQRVMTAEEQARLGEQLRAYLFDVAIDLAPAQVSRNLLLLAGARLTMGFGRSEAPWLDAAFDFDVEDERGRSSILPSAARTMALVEALAITWTPIAASAPPPLESEARLARFAVAPGGFVVLHNGGRIAFSRWPGYPALAEALIDRHDVAVVLIVDQPDAAEAVTERLRANPRFRLIEQRLPFAEMDALLTHARLFVGNDTGPKHLAALRGTPVVSVHSARANWGEWGQMGSGVIVTRQVPCAACHIYNDPDECTRGFVCVTAITVDEVLAAARPYLASR